MAQHEYDQIGIDNVRERRGNDHYLNIQLVKEDSDGCQGLLEIKKAV